MERILSTAQMQSADRYTINTLGIPEEVLVERAGRAVADEIISRFCGGRVLVCIGKGNNGADGRIIAEILSKKHGFSVATLTVSNGIFKLFEKKFDIIVDCIFGTGLNREVEGKYKTAIELINQSGAFVVSCDIPSGINGDNGMVMGTAVKANLTVAIQEYKLGHFLNYGPDFTGILTVKDIGISIWGDDYVKKFNNESVSRFFLKRQKNVNKGCFGKALVFGGSKKYSGSILLSANALAALKTGVGYSACAVPESLFLSYVGKVPECILHSFTDVDGKPVYDENNLKEYLKYDSISIGMGMGVSEEVYKIILYFLENYKGKLIIDADGLNALSSFGVGALKNKSCTVILTPHVGEFSRLCGVEKTEIISNSIEISKSFAKEYGVVLLLKSAVSIITDGEEMFINTTGSPALAKAGSGDVLSGIIAGMTARSDETLYSVVASAFLFGRCGEIACNFANEYTVTATEVIRAMPDAINSLFK